MFESNASVVFPICRFLRNSDLVIHLLITFENLEAYFYQADAEKISPKAVGCYPLCQTNEHTSNRRTLAYPAVGMELFLHLAGDAKSG